MNRPVSKHSLNKTTAQSDLQSSTPKKKKSMFSFLSSASKTLKTAIEKNKSTTTAHKTLARAQSEVHSSQKTKKSSFSFVKQKLKNKLLQTKNSTKQIPKSSSESVSSSAISIETSTVQPESGLSDRTKLSFFKEKNDLSAQNTTPKHPTTDSLRLDQEKLLKTLSNDHQIAFKKALESEDFNKAIPTLMRSPGYLDFKGYQAQKKSDEAALYDFLKKKNIYHQYKKANSPETTTLLEKAWTAAIDSDDKDLSLILCKLAEDSYSKNENFTIANILKKYCLLAIQKKSIQVLWNMLPILKKYKILLDINTNLSSNFFTDLIEQKKIQANTRPSAPFSIIKKLKNLLEKTQISLAKIQIKKLEQNINSLQTKHQTIMDSVAPYSEDYYSKDIQNLLNNQVAVEKDLKHYGSLLNTKKRLLDQRIFALRQGSFSLSDPIKTDETSALMHDMRIYFTEKYAISNPPPSSGDPPLANKEQMHTKTIKQPENPFSKDTIDYSIKLEELEAVFDTTPNSKLLEAARSGDHQTVMQQANQWNSGFLSFDGSDPMSAAIIRYSESVPGYKEIIKDLWDQHYATFEWKQHINPLDVALCHRNVEAFKFMIALPGIQVTTLSPYLIRIKNAYQTSSSIAEKQKLQDIMKTLIEQLQTISSPLEASIFETFSHAVSPEKTNQNVSDKLSVLIRNNTSEIDQLLLTGKMTLNTFIPNLTHGNNSPQEESSTPLAVLIRSLEKEKSTTHDRNILALLEKHTETSPGILMEISKNTLQEAYQAAISSGSIQSLQILNNIMLIKLEDDPNLVIDIILPHANALLLENIQPETSTSTLKKNNRMLIKLLDCGVMRYVPKDTSGYRTTTVSPFPSKDIPLADLKTIMSQTNKNLLLCGEKQQQASEQMEQRTGATFLDFSPSDQYRTELNNIKYSDLKERESALGDFRNLLIASQYIEPPPKKSSQEDLVVPTFLANLLLPKNTSESKMLERAEKLSPLIPLSQRKDYLNFLSEGFFEQSPPYAFSIFKVLCERFDYLPGELRFVLEKLKAQSLFENSVTQQAISYLVKRTS